MRENYQSIGFSCLIAALALQSAQAQTHLRAGYVVRTAGDTTRGWLDDRGGMLNARQCRFRPTPDAATILYAPKQLLAYGYDKGRVYETKTVADTDTASHPVFLQCLVRGEAVLYTLRNPDDSSLFFLTVGAGAPVALVDHVALVKVDGVNYQRGDQQYKKTLVQAFQKCLPMQASLNRVRLAINELVDVVQRYNTCVGSPMTIGGQTRLPNKFTLSVSA